MMTSQDPPPYGLFDMDQYVSNQSYHLRQWLIVWDCEVNQLEFFLNGD